jgi:hypothetical protein
MLGHLKPRFCQLSSPAKQHYQHLYCSICYSLRQQFGLSASFLINHELTLSLAAFPVYATMRTEECACPAKLFCTQKPILRDPLIDKAAQLCVLLVWLKLVDWETDSPAFYKKRLRQIFEAKVQPILADLSNPTRQFIDAYLLLIRANSVDFSSSVQMSGLLASHIFQELSRDCPQTQAAISEITLLLGELITLADALLDLKQDLKTQQFNPIIHATAENHTTLELEFRYLTADYEQLVHKIKQLLAAKHLTTINPVFSEILQQSLHNLTRKIQAAQTAMFTTSNNEHRNKRRDDFCDCVTECCDNCGDCVDCCQNKGSCCSTSESSGSCCESCNCCDCGGCDCSC